MDVNCDSVALGLTQGFTTYFDGNYNKNILIQHFLFLLYISNLHNKCAEILIKKFQVLTRKFGIKPLSSIISCQAHILS